tara:strand:+ start:1567 stop:3057 length:1491 start_codon:yes stop_codon:yes gene_type:complete
MSKHNLINKKIKKQILSINASIESNFNKLKYFKSNYKKIIIDKDNRVFLAISAVVILTLSYFLVPTFYNKNIIQSQIKNQILKNYNFDINFNEQITYGLLPRPHFSAKNLSILREKKEIAVVKNLKVFIGISDFFSTDKISIKNLVFDKTDFNIYLSDFLFFKNLLNIEPNDNKIIFKRSNLFFKNKNDEVLLINKIYNSEFFYDSKNLQNVLNSKNEVFKIPYKIIIKNDKFEKKILTTFNSKKIRLSVNNETSYDKKDRDGLLNILFINKDTSISYSLKKESLSFSSSDKKNSYKGSIDFKPFYFDANFYYEGLSSRNIFNNDSILIDLLSSEIFNNKNLSGNLSLKVKKITNINELNNLLLNITMEEGNIKFSDSVIQWKDDLKISLNESLLSLDDDGLNLIGTILLEFKDINNFYSSFQIQKKNRKDIKKIQIDFVYNFNTKNIRFDNPRVNNLQSNDLEEFLRIFNSQQNRVFNKITFKNFVNNFFNYYVG